MKTKAYVVYFIFSILFITNTFSLGEYIPIKSSCFQYLLLSSLSIGNMIYCIMVGLESINNNDKDKFVT